MDGTSVGSGTRATVEDGGAFINNVQVPIVMYQRAWLGIDNATENFQGHAHIPCSLIPINMVVSVHLHHQKCFWSQAVGRVFEGYLMV